MRSGLRYLLTLFGVLYVGGDALADVYRWVDEQGNPVFSDTPIEGAERMELGELPIVPALPVQRPTERLSPAQDAAQEEDQDQDGNYKALRIASPADGATIRNVREIPVSINLEPGLLPGHKIQFLLDGSARGEPVAAASSVLSDVNRGEHQIGATLIDEQGEVLLRADPITIYLHQTTINQHPGGS